MGRTTPRERARRPIGQPASARRLTDRFRLGPGGDAPMRKTLFLVIALVSVVGLVVWMRSKTNAT